MSGRKKILFIAASPTDLNVITWDKELKAISHIINKHTDSFEFAPPLLGAKVEDLDEYVHKKYWLIHLALHGKDGGKTIFEKDNGTSFVLRKEDFVDMVADMNNLSCVFLSACESDTLAEELESYVDYAIGFKNAVHNEDAVLFAKEFYDSFIKYGTIPFAYKDARRRLQRRKYHGNIQPVFKSKYNYIMNKIFEGKINDLKEKYALEADTLKEIDLLNANKEKLKSDILSLKKQYSNIKSEFLEENPFPRGVLWFAENQELLAHKLSKEILNGESVKLQEYFSKDLHIMFNFLFSALLTGDDTEYSKQDLKKYTVRVVKKGYYQQAFDLVQNHIPEVYSNEFTKYFRANCIYIKSLI